MGIIWTPQNLPAVTFQQQIVKEALGYVGVDRAHDRDQVTKFLNLFGLPFADENGTPYAFCAAGACYAAARALADLTGVGYTEFTAIDCFKALLPVINSRWFKPSARCADIAMDSQKRGTWYNRASILSARKLVGRSPMPGSLVFYNWHLPSNSTLARPDAAEHVEIVLGWTSEGINTVGFNTSDLSDGNGGAVAKRSRPLDCIIGIADPSRKG